MRIMLFILLTTVISCKTEELTTAQQKLKKSAIAISDLSKLNNKIYDQISQFEVIMIGEMHGTNEPAEFAFGLCDLITEHEENVIMAMEISPNLMENFRDDMSIEELKQLRFFDGENSTGMNGQAWLNLIAKSNRNKNIIVKFFDYQRVSPRDSSMYNAICDIRKSYPNSKIVTLSGNLHNRLGTFNNKLMLGGYIVNDATTFNQDKIMSIMHFFNQGTMLNNKGNGLELKTVEGKENAFNKTISSDMFLSKNIFEDRDYFTHILYTDKVSHSEKLENQ